MSFFTRNIDNDLQTTFASPEMLRHHRLRAGQGTKAEVLRFLKQGERERKASLASSTTHADTSVLYCLNDGWLRYTGSGRTTRDSQRRTAEEFVRIKNFCGWVKGHKKVLLVHLSPSTFLDLCSPSVWMPSRRCFSSQRQMALCWSWTRVELCIDGCRYTHTWTSFPHGNSYATSSSICTLRFLFLSNRESLMLNDLFRKFAVVLSASTLTLR